MCIFCKIAAGEIPSTKVYEDEYCFAFKDINPQAPVHVLLIPKEHIESVNSINEENANVVCEVMKAIPKVASLIPELKDGYRVISNSGKNAGQTVFHLHFHILGGKEMNEHIV
ncbi:MAG: histidine triad nucleotide-binding protein [Ruminococcaceae bacterium]|nr:histidine triad nucleotide-binding protein [Oscillospiraceae bacterium]